MKSFADIIVIGIAVFVILIVVFSGDLLKLEFKDSKKKKLTHSSTKEKEEDSTKNIIASNPDSTLDAMADSLDSISRTLRSNEVREGTQEIMGGINKILGRFSEDDILARMLYSLDSSPSSFYIRGEIMPCPPPPTNLFLKEKEEDSPQHLDLRKF